MSNSLLNYSDILSGVGLFLTVPTPLLNQQGFIVFSTRYVTGRVVES